MNATYTRSYGQNALASSTGVQLVIALYDGASRFLREAATAAGVGNAEDMREKSRRAVAILAHLQARLNAGVDEKITASLSEFYAATLALVLEGARTQQPARLMAAAECIANVRSAWSEASRGPSALPSLLQPGTGLGVSGWSA